MTAWGFWKAFKKGPPPASGVVDTGPSRQGTNWIVLSPIRDSPKAIVLEVPSVMFWTP